MEYDKRLREAVLFLEEGLWLCRAPLTLRGPFGNAELAPGVTYRRGRCAGLVDVADILDHWSTTGRLPPNISVLEAS